MIVARKKQQGFSLLEVLVAFSIFAMSLGIIFQIYSTGARSTIMGDEYTRAVIIAQSKLASIGIEEIQSLGELSGTEAEKYYWTARITPIEDESIELESTFKVVMRHVEVEINWDSLGKSRSIKLNTIKLIPVS
ncbi:MAG: prepilin-type N-terminal cleavage/methylation domain-containing protein [Proteobacteria bacterium]|nr:prepilin-type N-terminal cleavage/methylation domain-containing protein [Pseudomonadota bacterium]NOG58875.1 prepilin-type N-terminal cleavage/methylation domain-containing protein [Pseudomonadota bacterium]